MAPPRNKTLTLLVILAANALGPVRIADARPWWMRGAESNQNDFLPPDEAFRVSLRVEADVIRIRWVIADGYYLYRQRMEMRAESPDLVLAEPEFPPGTTKTDPYQGTQEIFTQQVEGTAAYTRSDSGAHPIQVKVTYQGCATAGLCYPPITKVLFPTTLAPATATATATATAAPTAVVSTDAAPGATPAAPPSALPRSGAKYAMLGGVVAFLLAGLLLRKGRRLSQPA